MLHRQHRCRYQDRYLAVAVVGGLKSSAQRYFCLAIPYVAADEAIHRLGRFHIFFHSFDSCSLVCRFGKGKSFFKLDHHRRVGRQGAPSHKFPFGLEAEQVASVPFNRLFGALAGLLPFGSSQRVEGRWGVVGAHVFAYQVGMLQRDKQFAVVGVAQGQKLFSQPFDVGAAFYPRKLAYAVVAVDYPVTSDEGKGGLARGRSGPLPPRPYHVGPLSKGRKC